MIFYVAGVLPFTIDPVYKNVYFLLGLNDQNYWDMFGGKRDCSENNFAITAAREFCEETLHTVYVTKNNLYNASMNKIVQKDLLTHKYLFRLNICNQITKDIEYVVYVKYVPYNLMMDVAYRFQKCRNILHQIQQKKYTNKHVVRYHPAIVYKKNRVDSAHMEMTTLKLYSLPMLETLNSDKPGYQIHKI